MNFTGGNTLPNVGKRINWQLVTLAGGLAVAVSAAIGFGALDKETRQSGGVTTATSAPATSAAETREYVRRLSESAESKLYLVASDAEKVALQQAVSTTEAVEGIDSVEPVIIVIESAEQEYLFYSMAYEHIDAGASIEVVDLRNTHATPLSYEDVAETSQQPLVVIVPSKEQVGAIEAAMVGDEMAAAMEGRESPMRPTSFVVVATPEDQYLYDAVMADEMGDGAFELIDLRN